MSKSSNKQPTVSIPQYSDPTPTGFNSPYGSLNYANGAYNYSSADAGGDAEIATLRDAIANHLGVTGPEQLQQTSDWQKAFMDAASKNASPALSNQMFNSGLGGSSSYGTAMGDLYSNLSTQAVLNGQNLNLANIQSQQNSFNALNSAYGQNQNYALNLAQMGAQYNLGQNQLATQRYDTTLPYLATVNYPKQSSGYGDLIGGVLGGVGGFALGGPAGAAMGAQLGTSLGGGINSSMGYSSPSTPYLNAASSGLSALSGAGFFQPSALQAYGGGTSAMSYNPATAANTNGLQFSVFK